MSFEYGGNGNYENHVVGFWGEFVAYLTASSDAGTDRFGDYVSIRRAPVTRKDPGNLFTAFGFGTNKLPPPRTGNKPMFATFFSGGLPASRVKLPMGTTWLCRSGKTGRSGDPDKRASERARATFCRA